MKALYRGMCALLCAALLSGCGLTTGAARGSETPAPGTDEEAAGMFNPLRPSDSAEILAAFGVEMLPPEGAEDAVYTIIQTEPPLAQLHFTRGGQEFTYRVARQDHYEDISGMYYEWEEIRVNDAEEGSTRLIPGGPGVCDRFDAQSGTIWSVGVDSGAEAASLEKMAAQLTGLAEAQAELSEGGEGELTSLLAQLHESYFPGTAGSSLSAAANAAALADFFFESGAEPDAVYDAATAYLNALPAEEKDLFDLQRQGVVSAFGYLTDEGGEGLLSDCGYAAAHYPWNEGAVRDCFTALLGSD